MWHLFRVNLWMKSSMTYFKSIFYNDRFVYISLWAALKFLIYGTKQCLWDVGATTSRVIRVIYCIVIDHNMYSVTASKTYRPVTQRRLEIYRPIWFSFVLVGISRVNCTMTREKGARTHPEDFYIIYSDNNFLIGLKYHISRTDNFLITAKRIFYNSDWLHRRFKRSILFIYKSYPQLLSVVVIVTLQLSLTQFLNLSSIRQGGVS